MSEAAGSRPYRSLDHLLVGTPCLERTLKLFTDCLGVQPQFGGSHPAHGTSNYLIALGERCYLELLGPTAPSEELDEIGRQMRDLPGDRLIGVAFETLDLDATRTTADRMGLAMRDPDEGERRRSDGQILRWRTARFDRSLFDPLMVFAIDWGETPHPSAGLSASAALSDVEIFTDSDGASKYVHELMKSDVPVTTGDGPGLRACIRTPQGEVRYSSQEEPTYRAPGR